MASLRILLVEDSENDAILLSRELGRLGHAIIAERVDTPAALKAALAEKQWDIVVSDYYMPDFSGLAALRVVRAHNRDLPFIIVSGTIGEDIAVDAMRAGANDYVMKYNLARLCPAVQRELNEARARAENLAARSAQQEKLDYLAYYDSITGLANRTLFAERLTQRLGSGDDSRQLAVLAVDIDKFKSLNDSLGSRLGDALLRQTAERLLLCGGDRVQLARVGADRFAVVLPQPKHEGEVARFVELLLRDCFAAPFSLGGTQLRTTASVGIAIYPADGSSAEVLLTHAEAAVGRARAGGEKYLFYTEEMTLRIAEQLALESRLRNAIECGEFLLYYQPKVDVLTRRIVALEALIRWQCPGVGLVSPEKFIPTLEATGMIIEVGAWALQRAAHDHRQWRAGGLPAPRIAVNVSVQQLHSKDFVDVVRHAVCRDNDPPGIDLEITESLLMEDIHGGIDKLVAIRKLGVGIAIDDFGMGHSSLAYLVKLPVQTLKIDKSFVAAMVNDGDTRTLVATIIALAHALRLTVVAEGVESEQQAEALRDLGCDEMQGYMIAGPMSHDQMTQLLGG